MDFYTLFGLADQVFFDFAAYLIIVYNIKLKEDIGCCTVNSFENAAKGCFTIDQKLHTVSLQKWKISQLLGCHSCRGDFRCFKTIGIQSLQCLLESILNFCIAGISCRCIAVEAAVPKNPIGRYSDKREGIQRDDPGDSSLRSSCCHHCIDRREKPQEIKKSDDYSNPHRNSLI